MAFRCMLLEFKKEVQAEDINLGNKGIQINLKVIKLEINKRVRIYQKED